MGRTIDADVLMAAFELDGYKSPYVARMINSCPTVEAQAEWISAKEHPPTKNGKYLATDGIEVDTGWYIVDHEMFYDGDGVTVFAPMKRVTHWMELPKAKMEGENGRT